MNKLSDLIPYIAPYLPGCPTPLVLQNLRTVFNEFCDKSEAWRETLTIDVVDGQTEYELVPTVGDCIVKRVVSVYRVDTFNRFSSLQMDVTQYHFDGNTTLTLYGTPAADATGGLTVVVSLRPRISDRTSEVYATDTFLERWWHGIVQGVFAALRIMPKRDWSDPALAQVNRADFSSAIALAIIENTAQYKRGNEARIKIPEVW